MKMEKSGLDYEKIKEYVLADDMIDVLDDYVEGNELRAICDLVHMLESVDDRA